jgi:hypothetical protein
MIWEFFIYAFHHSTIYRFLQKDHKHHTDGTEENRSDLAHSEIISRVPEFPKELFRAIKI